jgi:hypothetical protein
MGAVGSVGATGSPSGSPPTVMDRVDFLMVFVVVVCLGLAIWLTAVGWWTIT